MGVINVVGIVYIGLDALSDYEVPAAVGNSMFADLTSVAGKLYKFGHGFGQNAHGTPRKISIHADEFNELIGDEFIPLLNKAGGAGYQVTAYTQTWSDVEARIGSEAKAGQIGGNFNTLIMLRVKNTETAEMLTAQLPEVTVISVITSSSVSDTNDPRDFAEFASRNQDILATETRPMLSPADLVQLPKGQAFALIEGGQLYKIRMPLPDISHDPAMPENLEAIAREMERQYSGALGFEHSQLTVEGKGSGF
jgi:conjugal transfer pilus assembly protein TraD